MFEQTFKHLAKSILVSCIGHLGKIGMNSSPKTRFKAQPARACQKSIVNISLGFFVGLPSGSIDQQKELGEKLDSLFEEIQRLEAIYQREFANLDELKNPCWPRRSAARSEINLTKSNDSIKLNEQTTCCKERRDANFYCQ